MSCTNWSIKDQSLITPLICSATEQTLLLSSNLSLAASTLEEMAVKVAFLVTAALLTVAAAYPYNDLATVQHAADCSGEFAVNVYYGGKNYKLTTCTLSKFY